MSNIIELPSFTPKKGVSTSDFLRAHEKFHREFVSIQKGYISHKLLVSGETYFDLVVWASIEDKDNAFKAIYNSNAAMELISLIDDTGTDSDIPIFAVVKDY